MKNIIITGGAGFIGSNLAETILKKNLAKKIYIIDITHLFQKETQK